MADMMLHVKTLVLMLVLSFAVLCFLAGIFTMYFGAGKSKKIGGILLVVGIVVLAGLLAGEMMFEEEWYFASVEIFQAFAAIIGVILGAIGAIGMFLLAIMKS